MNFFKTGAQIILFLSVVSIWSCQQNTQPEPKTQCFEGKVVSLNYCAPVVQITNANIGEEWSDWYTQGKPVYQNCFALENLPENYRVVGQKISFTSYENGGVICFADREWVSAIKVTFCNQENDLTEY